MRYSSEISDDDVNDKLHDPGWRLPLLFRVTRKSLRHVAAWNNIDGRIPRAHIVCSTFTKGIRRSVFQPWMQLELGLHPDPYRFNMRRIDTQMRVPFVVIRLPWGSRYETREHFLPQSQYAVTCRFWRALVWIKGRGWRRGWVD